ncbi:nucleotide sugar dehydrogenase [Microbacterium sp.]|uniref:nucleotide sugar dehydrogenase n=1 Tax=Microbacterium sp. TaxID=51671 RepID=UPI0028AE3043|nr:nucleotide sugar dehydrogenase [Microbacterium sp.]
MNESSESGIVVVVGQGYVGLPIAMRAVEVGYDVIGIDVDPKRVDALNRGESYVEDVAAADLAAAIASGRYRASTDYAAAAGFRTAVVTVPTPLRETLPDLSYIEDAARSLAAQLTAGALVVLESTTYPGTTEELFVPLLEAGSGLRADKDFAVGYSPERIDPGNPTWNFVNTPKVVSGTSDASLERVRGFYESIVEKTVSVSTPREAELTKLLENTFRHVNIALINELAIFADSLNVNVWEAIDAASTKPFGYMRFTPGPGVGGHCLPVDPSYLSWQVRRSLGESFRFVELANDVNEHMPAYSISRLTRMLNRERRSVGGSRIVVLGVGYKKNTGDARESPANKIIDLLQEMDAEVVVIDAFVDPTRLPDGVTACTVAEVVKDGFDAAILVTDHDNLDYDELVRTGRPILDTRNVLRGNNVDTL